MYFRYLRIVLAVMLMVATNGAVVAANESDAVKIACNWLGKHGEQPNVSLLRTNIACVQFTDGWVLVCTNAEARPVIGYSPSGVFEPEVTSAQFLENLYEIAPHNTAEGDNKQKVLLSDNYIKPQFRNGTPLVTVQWGQGSPYNDLCPTDLDGKRPPAGCVPTAIAQIMNYWKYPSEGYSMNSYIPAVNEYGRLTVDFSAQTYNWENMSDQDIAKLFYHVGVAVEAGYHDDGSCASVTSVAGALMYYFGYSVGMQYLKRADYTNNEWTTILKNEIDQSRPVFYSGLNVGHPGHAWVIDDYDNNDMFHMNFGWTGSSDGYYSLTSPSGTYSSFSHFNYAIINIEPEPTGLRLPDPKVTIESMENRLLLKKGFTNYDELRVNMAFRNAGNKISMESVEWDLYVDDEFKRSGEDHSVLAEVLDTRRTTIVTIGKEFSPGMHTVKIVLDPDNKVEEINETNNEYFYEFEVLDAGNLPDITASYVKDGGSTWISAAPFSTPKLEEVEPGDSVYFNIIVTNKKDVPVTDPFYVALSIHGHKIDSILIEKLDYQEEFPISYGYVVKEKQSLTHVFILDSENTIAETDEENREMAWGVTVQKPGVPNVQFYSQDEDVYGYMYVSHDENALSGADVMYTDSLAYLFIPIENETDFDIDEPFFIEVSTVFDSRKVFKIDNLPAHTQKLLSLPYYPREGRNDDLSLTLDYYNAIDERDEFDNTNFARLKATVLTTTKPYLPEATGDMYVYEQGTFLYEAVLGDSLSNIVWHTNQPEMIEFITSYVGNAAVEIKIKDGANGHIALWYTAQTASETYRSYRKSLYVNDHAEQIVSLEVGWNLLSFNAFEDNLPLKYSFYPNTQHIIEAKSADGFWKRNYPEHLCSFTDLIPNKAYLLKSTKKMSVTFAGTTAPTEGFPNVKPGVNLLHFPFSEPKRIADYFNDQNCEYVKDLDGFWIPLGDHNSLTHFQPGKAYYVKVKP